MDEDKKNTDPAVAETLDTYPTPPAEVTVEKDADAIAEITLEKEAEAPPPPPSIEVTEVTVDKEVAKEMRVRV